MLAGLLAQCAGLHAASDPTHKLQLPTINNPYCRITTFLLPVFPEQATSLQDKQGHPVVLINSAVLDKNPDYGQFLMAHECCHHALGHVRLYYEGLGQLGPQPFYYIQPRLKQMELDADSCAVKLLKEAHNEAAIEAATEAMTAFGTKPTGAYYPTGIERANNIARASAER